MSRAAAFLVLLTALSACSQAQTAVRSNDDARMGWWREARFGIFIHWGVYAQLAGVWKEKEVRGVGEWIMDTAKIPVAEYETVAAAFHPSAFDAGRWVRAAKDAGMRYIVITSKHHDGFCMFDSKETDWDIVDRTPFKRDPLKELAAACEKEGLRLCFYHSIMDWHHPLAKGESFPKYVAHLKAQLKELLTGYGKIGVLWFDGEWIDEWTEAQGKDLYAYCRSLQDDLIVNNRVGKGRNGMQGLSKDADSAGDFGTPEQEVPAKGLPGVDWETCMTMNDTWGWKKHDANWKSTRTLLRTLVDVASKGGNFLLNVGPTEKGEIPTASLERLASMGQWLAANGESVYGTKSSPFERLPFGRCTQKPGRLYLHVFDWPASGRLVVPGLKNSVKAARLLAEDRAVAFVRDGGDWVLAVGPKAPNPDVSVILLEIAGAPEVEPLRIREAADGSVTLLAADARCVGESARIEAKGETFVVGYWTGALDRAEWSFEVPKAGRFEVDMTTALDAANPVNEFAVSVGNAKLVGRVPPTGAWNKFTTRTIGSVEIATPGLQTLTVAPAGALKGALMNLAVVRLRRLS